MQPQTDYEFHPAAMLLPLLDGEEYERLRADIAANGQIEPIWLHPDGRILDGRNRYIACRDLGIAPRFRQWDGRGSAVGFALSLNLHRRHLNSSQQAAVAVATAEFVEALEREARERQAHGQTAPGQALPQFIAEASDAGEAREKLADLFDTNRQYISDAKRLAVDAPDLFEQVRAGEMSIPQAKREAVTRQRRETPPLPTGNKYRVLYADPPWRYGNSGIIGATDHYGHTGRHYPSLSIDELCALPVGELADDDAVLFLWVTSPLLAECFAVIRAWGFAYKTSFIWDKVRHNFGHYNSVRHELLLVCTRGRATPDTPTLYDSVQTIERSNTHSEKPAAFRDIIDDLYPHGRRLELFARTVAAGNWEVWGNEPTGE